MPQVILCCPKCHQPEMNNFSFYESRNLNDNKYHYIFYNEIKQKRECKYWALLEEYGYPVHSCLELCNWCFDPCNNTPDVVTYNEYGKEINRQKDALCGIVCCILFLSVVSIIYSMYFTIFIWYDIYYACFKKRKRIREICTGQEVINIPDDKSFWNDYNTNLYTENY